jgi:transposase
MTKQYSHQLIDGINSIKPIKLSVTKNKEELKLKSLLYEETSFLEKSSSLAIRYYCIKNNIHSIPICLCGNNLVPNKLNNNLGFTKYCSKECTREFSHISDSIKSKLSDYEWLYNERIILEKSKDTIAEELGCSITPVNRWIKIHNIPDIKYNESNSHAMIHLRDKKWLFTRHKVENKKCEEIAEELDISKSTVSVWLNKHGIETNDPNQYDRQKIIISKPTQEIIDYIKTIYNGIIIPNARGIIDNLELDIYLPEINLAIEYNGVYSHLFRPEETNFSKRKDKLYHVTKTNLCEKRGIQLLHIFSSSWISKKEIWKSIIGHKLGKSIKIHARKCIIKDVSVYDKNIFMDENHLQGKDKSLLKYGLYYNGELLSVITFGKSRYNKNYDWELIRFAIKKGYSISGGFSKLLNHFKKFHNGSIVSYADRTYSNGKLYETNGFKLLKINDPAYWYVKKNTETLIHRSNFRKDKIKQNISDKRTEDEIMREKGFNKIFDCGTKTYVS